MPAYNCASYIEEAIDSVLAQTFQDFELIIINDGSFDDTERRLAKFQTRIRYVSQVNRGVSTARNVGIGLAQGELISFLDADDTWLREKLSCTLDAARAHPTCGIIASDLLMFDKDGVSNPSRFKDFPVENGNVAEKLLFHNWLTPSAVTVRRVCFDSVGTFDEEIGWGEDWMMWLRIALGFPIYHIPEVLVRYRVHPASATQSAPEKEFLSLLKAFGKIEKMEAAPEQWPQLVRQHAFRVCMNRGLGNLSSLDLPRARDKFRSAVKYNPQSVRARLMLAITWAPRSVLGLLKRTSTLVR
jgi:glycosyltransferase involved in cell wall biosynthesis